jgi:hypothetical protein
MTNPYSKQFAHQYEQIAIRRKSLFYISIKRKSKCLLIRKQGYIGTLIFGYSIMLKLFGKIIL